MFNNENMSNQDTTESESSPTKTPTLRDSLNTLMERISTFESNQIERMAELESKLQMHSTPNAPKKHICGSTRSALGASGSI